MNEMKYAPIIIPTLCRYEHFKNCVESLAQCVGADQTELFIGLDYPTKDAHWEGYKKISAYIETITGFKKVHIFRRAQNYGAVRNSAELRQTVGKFFDRYITTEDDNEFSPNFLLYMNEGLERFKDNPKVFCICGYAYSYKFCGEIPNYPFNVYPLHGYCAWGVGYWVEKREKAETFLNSQMAYRLIHSWRMVFRAFRHNQYITIHRLIFRHQQAYGDLMVRLYCAFNDYYCIFPTKSKVRNKGFDGSGTNCRKTSVYEDQPIDEDRSFDYPDIEIKDYLPIKKVYNRLYAGTFWKRIYCVIEYCMFRLFGFNSRSKWMLKIHRTVLKCLRK